MLPSKLSEQEEQLALAFMAGADYLSAHKKVFPDSQLDDSHRRHRAKTILSREHVKRYMDATKETGEATAHITQEAIEQYLWRVALKNEGKPVGLRAAAVLGKKYGIGSEVVKVDSAMEYDRVLVEIHNYYDAVERGENPSIPKILLEDNYTVEQADFEVISGDENE